MTAADPTVREGLLFLVVLTVTLVAAAAVAGVLAVEGHGPGLAYAGGHAAAGGALAAFWWWSR